MKATRTTSVDWLRTGLELLRSGGEDELTIDRLAKRVRRTKGSFYHHFADIEAFRRALLDEWKASHTLAPIAHAEGEGASKRRARLYASVAQLDHRLEVAIRAWAMRSADAKRAQDEVDERRVAYLTTLWKGRRAREFAELEYAAFLGLLHRHREGYVAHTKPLHTLVRALEALG